MRSVRRAALTRASRVRRSRLHLRARRDCRCVAAAGAAPPRGSSEHVHFRHRPSDAFASAAAERALEQLNYTKINDKPIRLMWSHRDPNTRKNNAANIFIKARRAARAALPPPCLA